MYKNKNFQYVQAAAILNKFVENLFIDKVGVNSEWIKFGLK